MTVNRELRGFSYKNTPLKKISHADGWLIYFEDGTSDLDLSMGGSSFILGYNNPAVTKGVEDDLLQFGRCQSNRGHYTDKTEQAAKILTETGKWSWFSWAVTGTSAVEAAVAMNDSYWGNTTNKIITFPITWHGTSYLTKALGGTIKDNRVIYCKDLKEVEYQIRLTNKVGAVLLDSCSWFQGNSLKEPHWWEELRSICDKHDVLLIVDDVANGWGKCKAFYSYETFGRGVKPDIVAVGKSLAAGYTPIGASVCNNKVGSVISKPGKWNFNHTHQPNMAGITMMINTYNYIQEHNLMGHASVIERRLQDMAFDMIKKKKIVSFKSAGLFLTLKYSDDLNVSVGLSTQVNRNKLRICAPLIANDQYFDELKEVLYA